jgi:hypothetical protein
LAARSKLEGIDPGQLPTDKLRGITPKDFSTSLLWKDK